MQENKEKKNWNNVERYLASEIISGREKVSKTKDFAIGCLTVAVITMAAINYKNDSEWRKILR